MPWIREDPRGSVLLLHAQPGARASGCAGAHGDRLKIRLRAPPVEGKANEELLRFLSERLGIPRARAHLLRGETSRKKDVLLEGVDAAELKVRIGASVPLLRD